MTINSISVKQGIVTFMLVLVFASALTAQDSLTQVSPDKKWSFFLEPYIMFPNLAGTTGLGILPDATLDASPGDIFSKLNIGFMLFIEASSDKWAINSDLIYADLKQDIKPGRIINGVDATAKQISWETAGLRRVTGWLEVGAGGILNSITSGVALEIRNADGTTTSKSAEMPQTWFDPMIIARIKSKAGKRFIYQFQSEIGGFGVGSDLAWQLQAYAGYRFSKLFQITGGYRVISVDYTTGSGKDRFLYDTRMFGPVLRFGFNL
jgi:hypothetical protein